MDVLKIILPILIGAVIGYLTNFIAIKMLFLPRREWHIGKMRVPFTPGVIPKNKARVASAVATAVSERLLTEADVAQGIKNSGIKDEIIERILETPLSEGNVDDSDVAERVSYAISDRIIAGIQGLDMNSIVSDVAKNSFSSLLSNPMVSIMLGGAMDSICNKLSLSITDYVASHGRELLVPRLKKEIDGALSRPLKSSLEFFNLSEDGARKMLEGIIDSFIEDNISNLISRINIKDIVEEKVNKMDVKELEALVMLVMKNELRAIVNLGALIGAIIGVVNIFI